MPFVSFDLTIKSTWTFQRLFVWIGILQMQIAPSPGKTRPTVIDKSKANKLRCPIIILPVHGSPDGSFHRK